MQGHQQVLGGVVQFGVGEQAVETDARKLAQPDGHAPGLVAQPHGAAWKLLQARQRTGVSGEVVEQGEAPRFVVCQRPGQALGIAPQPGTAVHGGGDVNVDHRDRPYVSVNSANRSQTSSVSAPSV